MKQRKITMFLLVALLICIGSMLPASKAEAGKNITILDKTTVKNADSWYSPEDDVLTDGEKITFTKDSSKYTKLISRVSINANQNNEEFLVLDCSVKFSQLPEGESFVIGLGILDVEPSLGDKGNVEITFTNNGGMKLGVNAYKEAGVPIVVSDARSCGMALNKAATVHLAITKDSKLNLTVNGKSICSSKLPVSGSGKVGFLQTGKCAVEITELDLKGYNYVTPENTNVFEDFEKGFDISKIHVANTYEVGGTMLKPARVAVEEYDGNKGLNFVNAGGYYFTTKFQYSNFEMTFDIPYAQMSRDMWVDDGTSFFYDFGVLFGVTSDAPASWNNTDAAEGILFNRNGNVKSVKMNAFETVAKDHLYGKEFQPFTVKISVIDGKVTVGVKWVEEKNYEILGSYEMTGGSPTGYIRFGLPTTDFGNLMIDNIKITNMDKNAQLIETEYKNGLQTFKDMEYEPFERVYADKKVVAEAGKNQNLWYLAFPAVALVGGAMIGTSFLIAKKKVQKGKEASADET